MPMLTRDEILEDFRQADALLEGHFVLTSGNHSNAYLQCARIFMDPGRAERLCAALASTIRQHGLADGIDVVVSPAMGGIIAGYELGRQLGVRAIFVERVNGAFTLRRGFGIASGERCLIMEDVVTTGLSTRECMSVVQATGGQVVAVAALVDRSGGNATFGAPFIPLIKLDIPHFPPDHVPDWLAAIPATKPGSRGLKA